MISPHFLRDLFVSIMGIIFFIITFILVMDPYSLLSDKPLLWRHALRFEDPWRDGRAMRLALFIRQPRTIILGSSRVALGFDVRHLKNTFYWPAYNAATYNSSLIHRLSMLKYAILIDRRIKHVFIEISPIDVMHAADFWRLQPVQLNLNLISEAFPLIFSDTAIRDATRVLGEIIKHQDTTCTQSSCGQPRLRRSGGNGTNLKILHESGLVSYRLFSPLATVDPTWRSTLSTIISTCHQYGLDCKLFISPLNARILYGYQRFNQWSEIETMIESLVTINKNTTIYNFLWYNSLTDESIEKNTSAWIDSIHFSTAVGDVIMNAISNRISEKTKEGEVLWSTLTRNTLSATLKELRIQRDHWLLNHPETVWSYGNLLKNIQEPLVKSQVNFRSNMPYITINDRKWQIQQSSKDVQGDVLGHLFRAASLDGDINGWAVDMQHKVVPEHIAIIYHNSIVAWGRPWVDMSNIKILKHKLSQSGFQFVYHIPPSEKTGSQLRIFALFKNNSAIEIGSGEQLNW